MRELDPPAVAAAGEAPSALPATALQARVQQAATSRDPKGVDTLNRELASLPRDGGRPVADALLRLLEGGRLEGLVDTAGRSARATAAMALVGMGYPYALELSPEDLDHLRQAQGPRTPRVFLVAGLGLVWALGGLEFVAGAAQGREWVVLHSVLTVGTALGVALTRPGTRLRRWAMGALVLAGAVGIQLGLVPTPAALLSGLAALIAAALMSKKRYPPAPIFKETPPP